jgi:diguanylate cyclase (GGDEF)-like protein
VDQIDEFAKHVGPQGKASASALGRAESQVDRILGREWNALRAQLRVRGRTVGMMTVATMVDRVFNASDLLFVAAVADQVAMAIDRARQFASEARTDHLSGLANRREFERVMEREVALAERHNRRLALMMIDLDNLKRINDKLGHSAGDSALRLVSQQLLRVVRASDLCARVGGDEFAVAMPETDIDRARDVATRLRRAVDQGGLGMRTSEHVEVSVGIAAWTQGQDWQTVYQAADRDLYEDKRRRKTVRRWQHEDRQPTPIRILGRGTGRRRVSGA